MQGAGADRHQTRTQALQRVDDMEPWYRVVTLRQEVREGRSFSPDEFAIALEQVVDGTAPEDYSDPHQFFSRTCFTQALTKHTSMVLRRLAGETANTAPVVSMVTQFGGGKTHTLTSLYHLARAGNDASKLPGIDDLLENGGDCQSPGGPSRRVRRQRLGPPPMARKRRGSLWPASSLATKGSQHSATAARTTPPGTDAISRAFAAANGPVLLLFDEVLNFVNRHRSMAESFHAFIQSLTVAVTGTNRAVAFISLPRSQVEMTDWDQQWQERITKVVGRVAQDVIANDEADVGEVVRRRLFESLGPENLRKRVAKSYAQWCFERSAFLPPEWTAVDTASSGAKAKDLLTERFLSCYPFHPATLSVFQRKWRALSQYQQTRGTLAMLAQWISVAGREHFQKARREPLITLGSAPLHVPEFRAAILGQLGEARLEAAIDADLAGATARVKGPDADTRGPHRDIHRRVGTAILFESSGGQVDKVAHLPELRFALGDTDIDTTTIDSTAATVEDVGFFIRRVGTDGYRIHHKATLKKVVSDRRASLDEEAEIEASDAQAGGIGVCAKGGDPHHRVPGGRQRHARGQQRGPGPAEAETGRDGSRDGMARKERIRSADCAVDQGAREVAETVPGRLDLVREETRARSARSGRSMACVAARRAEKWPRESWGPSSIEASRPRSRGRSGRPKTPPRTRYGAATDTRFSRIRESRRG